MWFVVAGLMAVVIWMSSRKEKDSEQTGDLPPNSLLPGTGASAVQSPATTGANPLSSQAGKLIAGVTSRLPGIIRGAQQMMVTPVRASTDPSGQKALLTQVSDPTVPTVNRGLINPYRKF